MNHTILQGLSDIQSIRYSHLASATIIIFDHLITIDSEVELIWKSSWSLGKAMFFLNRYYTLVSVIVNTYGLFSPSLTDNFCLTFFRWQGWTGLVSCMISEIILQMRIYALYSLDKRILALMVVCFLGSIGTSAWVMGSVLSKIHATASHLTSNFEFCVPHNLSDHFFVFWIPMLAFETLLCGLALFRGYQTFRSSNGPFASGKHIVGILIRDSLLYFLVMFATYLTNLLVWIGLRQSLLEIPIGFSVALACVMGNRVIFNVRALALEQDLLPGQSKKIHVELHTVRTRSISIASSDATLSHSSYGMTLSEHERHRLRCLKSDRDV